MSLRDAYICEENKCQDRHQNDKHQIGERDYLCKITGEWAVVRYFRDLSCIGLHESLLYYSIIIHFSMTKIFYNLKKKKKMLLMLGVWFQRQPLIGPVWMIWAACPLISFFPVKCGKLGHMLTWWLWVEWRGTVVLSPSDTKGTGKIWFSKRGGGYWLDKNNWGTF